MRPPMLIAMGCAVLALLLAPEPLPGATARDGAHSAPLLEPLRTPMRETGVHGGRFVLAVTAEARTFNPILAGESGSLDVCERLFTTLAKFDNATQQYGPALARDWTASADRRTWTWRLRRGARFSDGHPITSADVLFSFELAADSTLPGPLRDAMRVHGEPIKVTAPDSYTVVTRIARPFALVVATVASLPIVPRHVLEPAWRSGRFASAYGIQTPPESLVTSGPWILKRHTSRERTVLAPNPCWFGVDARGRRLPYLDEVVLAIVPDQNTAALRFLSKAREVDALDNTKPEDYAAYLKDRSSGDFTLHDVGATLTSNFFWFNLNTTKSAAPDRPAGTPLVGAVKYAWFSSREFRRAVSMAIDRDAMIRSVFLGHGVKSWSLITPGNRAFHSARPPANEYDPAAARRLLARLGFRDRDGDGTLEDRTGNPVRFTLRTNANSNVRMQLANLVRDDLSRVGIQCVLAPVDPNTMAVSVQDRFDYDAALGGLGTVVPPDPAMGANFYRSSGATHFWNAGQPRPETPAEARLDSLFEAVESNGDPALRRRVSAEMDRLIDEQCWVIWLPVSNARLPVRNRFGNLQPSGIRHRLLWNIETVFVRPVAAKR